MNHGLSILFRAIPLLMAAFCFSYGAYIYGAGDDPARLTAGPVVFFLGSICVALYCTAATIIRQIIGTYNEAAKYILPTIGYAFALMTLICGIFIIHSNYAGAYVTGRVVCGLALIAVCVATAAAASTRFRLIPINSAAKTRTVSPGGFKAGQVAVLMSVAATTSAAAWIWAFVLFGSGTSAEHTAAGSVMAGIACVCTSLVALVASIARQIRGTYTTKERTKWMGLVLVMGCTAFVFGLVMIIAHWGQPINFVGFVLIGLAMICWSISSKVILLAKIWQADFPLADRIPLIPVITALTCLFFGAYLFEEALSDPKYFVPARVLTGFGAICFTLFSIVSILESGTENKK